MSSAWSRTKFVFACFISRCPRFGFGWCLVLMLEWSESFTCLEYLFAHDLMKNDEQLEMIEIKFRICVQDDLTFQKRLFTGGFFRLVLRAAKTLCRLYPWLEIPVCCWFVCWAWTHIRECVLTILFSVALCTDAEELQTSRFLSNFLILICLTW